MGGACHAEELESLRREVRALAAIVASNGGREASSRGERSIVGSELIHQNAQAVNASNTGGSIGRCRGSVVAPTATVRSTPENLSLQEGELHYCHSSIFVSPLIAYAQCFLLHPEETRWADRGLPRLSGPTR